MVNNEKKIKLGVFVKVEMFQLVSTGTSKDELICEISNDVLSTVTAWVANQTVFRSK